ncbi:helix-turn-helix domain-containing protein [Aquamicrobium zhengzhouense]|nr:helix-turn-helix transcriptional regulator [Aquamicrobium zhengzhouense]
MPDTTTTIYSELPDDDTLGGRLSRARENARMSAPQLARRIGVQENTLEAWERDRDQPRGNRLSMVAGVLNVSLPWLLHGIGKGPATEKRTEFVPQLSQQLDQLKRLHRQTADLIGRLERDITRAAS